MPTENNNDLGLQVAEIKVTLTYIRENFDKLSAAISQFADLREEVRVQKMGVDQLIETVREQSRRLNAIEETKKEEHDRIDKDIAALRESLSSKQGSLENKVNRYIWIGTGIGIGAGAVFMVIAWVIRNDLLNAMQTLTEVSKS